MDCFVIMPFSSEFDDVYATIKSVVGELLATSGGRCFRLDETRPAGRITNRLLTELRGATLCIADLSGTNPNVMWELGFVMALGKPTIIVTQSQAELPFDIRDMQSLQYQRSHLNETLGKPLRRMLLDTVGSLQRQNERSHDESARSAELVGTLLTELAQLKQIVGEVVRNSTLKEPATRSETELLSLTGCWEDFETDGHYYTEIIHGELVTAYCFGGNDHLTGAFYAWRRTGEYWFARFKWLGAPIEGFAFVRQSSLDDLVGAWWYGDDAVRPPEVPPALGGEPLCWKRTKGSVKPEWAVRFFTRVEDEGLPALNR